MIRLLIVATIAIAGSVWMAREFLATSSTREESQQEQVEGQADAYRKEVERARQQQQEQLDRLNPEGLE